MSAARGLQCARVVDAESQLVGDILAIGGQCLQLRAKGRDGGCNSKDETGRELRSGDPFVGFSIRDQLDGWKRAREQDVRQEKVIPMECACAYK